MGSKHLKELLKEDQEPFILKNYIDDIKRSVPKSKKTQLQIKKQNNPISFTKNLCFLSSPDVKKSPMFEFRSPLKTTSPCRNSNSNTLFVHIPTRTATLLLEAAMRIQKSSVSKKKWFFGSILKRIGGRKSQKSECNGMEKMVSVKEIIRWEEKVVCDMGGLSCSCNSRRSSVWSESNEEKSFDLETSSSSRSEDSAEFDSSPFQFVLHNNLSPNHHQQAEFDTPKQSPSRIKRQEVGSENGSLNDAGNKYEEEEKEQNSPVSVLDPPFEDDDDDEDDGQEDVEAEKDGFDLERNFANVQRAKLQLLQNLRRFEKLAELDPLELEMRIAEQEDEDSEFAEQCHYNDDGLFFSVNEKSDSLIVRELLAQSNMHNCKRIPSDIKRLVLDLAAEEGVEETDPCSREFVVKKVCKRLESWKEVESNTIDMMVEFDFKRDANEWLKNPEQLQDVAAMLELAIFDILVEELSDELYLVQ
ncbi:hypothetical protein IFM89_002123 [Coptis chinensis]|uniref:DUF4378 domain-containing protein n=1 Tax=Coptis chinensis TaxID=261450 RepID=A0A835H404_9MAGN|nr:hypothetical protein IFM89_002123 [Coptis chinensis]